MGIKNDYRVSKIAVLCKDCNQDVGLYPARHKCSSATKRLQLPTLCSSTSLNNWNQQKQVEEDMPDLIISSPGSISRQPSDSSMESGKWNPFVNSRSNNNSDAKISSRQQQQRHDVEEADESVYFDNYASQLLNSSTSLNELNNATNNANGKRLWGRVKENEKWKELIAEKNAEATSKPSNKLWQKIIQVTMPSSVEEEEYEPESDNDDWEGETHVSRILREYYIKNKKINNSKFPSWLIDDRTPISALAMIPATEQLTQEELALRKKQQAARRLWQSSEIETLSPRQKEIQALRQAEEPNKYYNNSTISRSQSERVLTHASPTSQSSARYYITRNRNTVNTHNPNTATPRRTHTTKLPENRSPLMSRHNYF
ncbi:MAG: hypothetical protein EXX96DRAFT_579748 [Benjaminiella poitrasii]|nr:MAG: hypothetical protein EXX96DRAFT_579748 [Benjaminiella poitrasii]